MLNNKRQTQETIQITAHQKKLVFNTFHNTIESLEEYIEKAGFYPDFKNKKQIFVKSINDANRSSAELADDFLAQLFCLKGMVNNKPEFLRKEVQESFHKWINAVGIDINNCPKELKHFVFEINEVLEGRGEKIVRQTRELINDGRENDPKDMLKIFSALQEPLNKNREQGNLLAGKTHKDIKIESRFSGSGEMGKEALDRISRGTVSEHDDYHFFSQQNRQLERTNSQIIQDVKDNPQNWRIDEVITEYDNYGRAIKKALALIHSSAQIGYDGSVLGDSQSVYLANRFNQAEIAEVNQILNISLSSSSVHQTQTQQRDNRPRGGGSGWGGANKYIAGSFGIISLIALVFIR